MRIREQTDCLPQVILATAAWLLLTGGPGCSSQAVPQASAVQAVARVNNQVISVDEVRRLLKETLGDGQSLLSAREDLQQLKRSILEQIIDETLLLQEAQKLGMVMDAKLVEAAVERAFANYPAGGAEEQLLRLGIDMTTFRERIYHNLLAAKLLKQQVTDRLAVPREEVEKYYAEHKGEFVEPEKVHVRQILVRSQEEAEQLRKRILRGESFEQLARDNSLSPEARRGGDLATFARGQLPPEMEEQCFALFQAGQVSKVVPSSYGFHLFQLMEKTPAREIDPKQAMRQIEKKLLEERGREARVFYMRQLREKAKIERNLELLDAIH